MIHHLIDGPDGTEFCHELVSRLRAAGQTIQPYALPGADLYTASQPELVPGEFWLLICSRATLSLWWVEELILHIIAEERRHHAAGRRVFFLLPVVMDDYFFDEYRGGCASSLRSRQAVDFRGWSQSLDLDAAVLERLVSVLSSAERPAPPPQKLVRPTPAQAPALRVVVINHPDDAGFAAWLCTALPTDWTVTGLVAGRIESQFEAVDAVIVVLSVSAMSDQMGYQGATVRAIDGEHDLAFHAGRLDDDVGGDGLVSVGHGCGSVSVVSRSTKTAYISF